MRFVGARDALQRFEEDKTLKKGTEGCDVHGEHHPDSNDHGERHVDPPYTPRESLPTIALHKRGSESRAQVST